MINKIFIISVLAINGLTASSMLKKKEIKPGIVICSPPTVLDFNSCATKKDCEDFQKASLEYEEYMDNERKKFDALTNKRINQKKNPLIK